MAEIVVDEGWRDRLERWGGRRKDSVVLLVVVGVVGAAALLLWQRNPPAQIAPPSQPVEAPLQDDPAIPGAAEASPTAVVLVHVSGAVERPGLYELPLGARVADAIDLAKGPRPAADLDSLNLAEPLADGQKVDVPRRGETVAAVPAPTTAAPGASTATTIDLNTADQAALETIPGVGPVTAAAILTYRDEIGGFDSIDQLLEVTGIGPATLESMRAYISV
jgi:competence protein ComEA